MPPRKTTILGSHLIGHWLFDEGWNQESVAHHIGVSRQVVRKYLNNPGKYLTIEQLAKINMILPDKTWADIINSITRAPMASNLYVEEEYLITPRIKRTSWTDMD